DAELELPSSDLVDDRLRVGDRQPYVDVRIRLLELAEQERDDRAARPCRRAHLKRARQGALVAAGDVLEQLVLEREQLLRGRVQTQPGLGRLDPPAGPVEQAAAEPLLERANLEADGGLGDTEPLRSLGEALPLDDRAEGGQLARVHKHPLCDATAG